jgi:hypothetical protein
VETEYVLDKEISQSGRIDIGPARNQVTFLRKAVDHNPNSIAAL